MKWDIKYLLQCLAFIKHTLNNIINVGHYFFGLDWLELLREKEELKVMPGFFYLSYWLDEISFTM